jgi:pimeloyl-ACP methyl ester carboxylesterase
MEQSNQGRGRRLALPGGRAVGYDEHGPADGHPIFYFHGVPSSRLDFQMFGGTALAERLGVRIIAVDRPGCGQSDYLHGRQLSDWPADVAALADDLGLSRFAVMGWSGGGPYALACARAIPERVTTAAVVSCMGPHNVSGLTDGINPQSMRFFKLNRDRPVVGRLLDRFMALGARRDPEKLMARTLGALPPVDREAMSAPAVADAYVAALRECFRKGPRGGQSDTSLMVSPWDFEPRGIQIPVMLWHGELDADAPPAMGHWLAKAIPTCRARFFADEGHISLIVNHAETIARSLVG